MKYLLDTHTILWSIYNPKKLSKKVKTILLSDQAIIYVSAINFWEISIKYKKGKLNLLGRTPNQIKELCTGTMAFQVASLDIDQTASFYQLKANYHRDPFDRMLIWQAIKLDLTLITNDNNIHKYTSEGLICLW